MTETATTPYTENDLRAEAARQMRYCLEAPQLSEVGDAMWYHEIESTGQDWNDLYVPTEINREFTEAREAVTDLLYGAADLADWAIDLGADGLTPHPGSVEMSGDGEPILRMHFAFGDSFPEHLRDEMVREIGLVVGRALAR